MAKEIVVWCEIDLTEREERVHAREHEITIDGKTWTIDLCTSDYESRLGPLLALLEQYGQPTVKRRGPYKKTKTSNGKASNGKATLADEDTDNRLVCDHPGCGRSFARTRFSRCVGTVPAVGAPWVPGYSQPEPSPSRSRCEPYPGSPRRTGAAPAARAASQLA